MKNTLSKQSNSLLLDEEIFSLPASVIDGPDPRDVKSRHRRKKSPELLVTQARQAGLSAGALPSRPASRKESRAGNERAPRKADASASRQETRRIELMLAPDIAASLEALSLHFKESRADVVSRLVAKAAARMFK